VRGVQRLVLDWYASNARDLPWRRPGTGAWAVTVSEFMLQQTPVGRVLPVYEAWLQRWPTPPALAADSPGEAVRAWGRLGYPRRALRLYASARLISQRHEGQVPIGLDDLRALPGVGEYTAAAIASFAHRQRHVVLDTNVRRVLARLVHGHAEPARALTVAERAAADSLLPSDADTAARWSVAVMELGALVCTASRPACNACPVEDRCAWRAAGYPRPAQRVRHAQAYAGTDRQCRGRLLAVLRDATGPVRRSALERAWTDAAQRDRCLAGLVADGLIHLAADQRFGLGHSVAADSTGGASGSSPLAVPLKVKAALGPSPSTSTSTI
jgi:A/G-specific adenine glycosylase